MLHHEILIGRDVPRFREGAHERKKLSMKRPVHPYTTHPLPLTAPTPQSIMRVLYKKMSVLCSGSPIPPHVNTTLTWASRSGMHHRQELAKCVHWMMKSVSDHHTNQPKLEYRKKKGLSGIPTPGLEENKGLHGCEIIARTNSWYA